MKRREKGEGSIYQRADGRWCASIGLGYDAGRYQRKVLYGKTRKEVADKLKQARTQRDQGMTVRTDRQTVGQLLTTWIASVKQTVAPATYHRYAQDVRVHLIPALGSYRLSALTAERIARLLQEMLAAGSSPATVRHCRVVLGLALKQAMAWRLVAWNVATAVPNPKLTQREAPILEAADIERFLRAMREERLSALFILALLAGMRHGELLGLRWEDIDLAAGTVRIQRSLSHVGTEKLLRPPKTTSGRRTVGLPVVAVAALRAHRVAQERERQSVGSGWEDHGLVFTTATGRPLSQATVRGRLYRALDRAGLPHLRLHDLRHAYASLLLTQNVHPKVVSEALGHSEIGITMDLYSHVMPSSRMEIVSRLDALLAVPDSET